MAIIDMEKQRRFKEIKIGKENFELWLEECEDIYIKIYISDLMARNEGLGAQVEEYQKFFDTMYKFLPKKYIAPQRF